MTASQARPDSPGEELAALTAATERLLRSVRGLEPAEIGEPSLLPGWTRGHVLSHVSRNADALVRLLGGARDGEHVPLYDGPEARERDIQAGAARTPAEHAEDLLASSERLAEAIRTLPAQAWLFRARLPGGDTFPTAELPWRRLGEVEYHHVDLDAGYSPGHWPADFVARELVRVTDRLTRVEELPSMLLRNDDTGEELVIGSGHSGDLSASGPAAALLAWLSGRADADGLTVRRGGERVEDARAALPDLPVLG